MGAMTEQEWRAFVLEGTRTGKLATVRKDGRPHVMPSGSCSTATTLVFTTAAPDDQGRHLRREGRVCLCVDEETARRSPF